VKLYFSTDESFVCACFLITSLTSCTRTETRINYNVFLNSVSIFDTTGRVKIMYLMIVLEDKPHGYNYQSYPAFHRVLFLLIEQSGSRNSIFVVLKSELLCFVFASSGTISISKHGRHSSFTFVVLRSP
jgi:hypothetical protein